MLRVEAEWEDVPAVELLAIRGVEVEWCDLVFWRAVRFQVLDFLSARAFNERIEWIRMHDNG